MPAMDQFLAEYYGNNTKTAAAAPDAAELEKQASVQLFLKLAAEQNIDLKSMPDDQVQTLYNNWVKGAAAEEPPKHEPPKDEEKEKKEKAEKEHEEKKAAAEKFAEAEFLGRVMAHSMVAEMRKIAEANATPEAAAAAAAQQEKEAAMPEALRKGLEAARGHAGKAMGAVKEHAGHAAAAAKEHAGHAAAAAKKHPGVTHGAAAAVGAGAGAGAAHAMSKHHGKEASAIDSLAAERAVHFAHEGGFDAEEAGRKVAAIITLGLQPDDTKVAAAADLDAAVNVRALELLEKAGYPVTWNS